jgi:2-succinyl-6-hydroxy-2,4-cyclohexadiene-1-carboxylate synthase
MKDVADAVDALMKPMPTVARDHPVSSLAWRMLAEGEGDPVLLLHGFTRSAASWEPLVPLLAGHPLIAVDLMGHGLSPVPVDINAYRLEYAAARIEELLDRLGLQRIHLVGYSMGGRTAMACAASFTGRIASLALISAHPGIEDTAERDERRASDNVLADRIETHGLETFVREWSGGDMFGAQRAQDPGAWQRAVADRMQRATAGLARSLRGSGQGEQNPYWNVLRQCSFPTLIAAGTRDVRYTEILQRMCDLLPDSEQLRCADAGHDLLFERPQELADALLALWKRA